MTDTELPPVTQIAIVSFALIVASGIWIVSHLPKHVPLAPSFVLIALSALLLVGNVVALRHVDGFDWTRFLAVAKWALLAYVVLAGLVEYAFVKDGTRGGALVVLTLSLAIFAIHVPLLIGYTVARYPETYD